MLDSLFNKLQAFRPVTFSKKPPAQAFSPECCKYFVNSFFCRTPLVAAFMSTQKGRRGKCGTKEREKLFQMKEENENFSLNFYLQVLLLVKTEMQIQLCKCYRTALPFFLTFSSNFYFCDFCVFIFCVLTPDKLKNMSCYIY